jgi:hypothetical protein
MSAVEPDSSRLEQLRNWFEKAAYDSPNVGGVVVYRPSLRLSPSDGHVLDRSDTFLRHFFLSNGELSPTIRCLKVNEPPYRQRESVPPHDTLDWEGIVRQSWADDPRTERPRWWPTVFFLGDSQYKQFDMFASDAAKFVLGNHSRCGKPAFDWLVYLAEQIGVLAPTAQRWVVLAAPRGSRAGWEQVQFAECPSELREEVTRNPLPSWWAIDLAHVFRLSRDAIDQELTARMRGDDPKADGAGENQQQSDGTSNRPEYWNVMMEEAIRLHDNNEQWADVKEQIEKKYDHKFDSPNALRVAGGRWKKERETPS